MLSTESKDDPNVWSGSLTCLEFLLTRSLQLRLQNYPRIPQECAQMASAMATSADPLLLGLKSLNPSIIADSPRFIQLVTLSSLVGTLLYYIDPECSQVAGTRCCPEHRIDGFQQGLSILRSLFLKHPRLADKYRTVTVLLGSVVSVAEHGTGLGAVANFGALLDGLFSGLDQSAQKKTAKIVAEISREISQNNYDVDMEKFEEALADFLSKQAHANGAMRPCLVDRFSDLISAVKEVPKVGENPVNGDSGAEVDTESPSDEQQHGNGNMAVKEAPIDIPKGLLHVIPGSAFRSVFGSDEFLESIIHRTNHKVAAFIQFQSVDKTSRLTDRHDSAIQVEWTQPTHIVSDNPGDRSELDRLSAVNPSFVAKTPRPAATSNPLAVTSSILPSHPSGPVVVTTPVRTFTNRNSMRHPWSPEEERNLIAGYNRFGPEWRRILSGYAFNGRSNVDLKDKFRNLVRGGRITRQQ